MGKTSTGRTGCGAAAVTGFWGMGKTITCGIGADGVFTGATGFDTGFGTGLCDGEKDG